MNKILSYGQTILKFAGSRLAMNICLWVFLFTLKYPDADDQEVYSKAFYYSMMIFLMGLFALIGYGNNFVLMPKLLFRKKRLLYVVSAFLLTFSVAFLYTFLLKWLPTIFPGLVIMEMSMVMSPVSADMSVGGILADIETYLSFMLIWITVFALIGYSHHSIRKMRNMELALNKHRETELAFIKNQMNPHFLFNTLNNLYGLAIKKSDDTPEIILQLSSILRYILYESNAEKVSFDKEKEIIQAYIDIELLRVPQTPEIQFSIMADKPYQLPPLLWLAPLENVFKHSRSADSLEVDFRLSIVQNVFKLYCKNNFKQPLPNQERQAGGLGLVNLQKRLNWLYPNKYTLTTTVQENYFIIDLTIQLS